MKKLNFGLIAGVCALLFALGMNYRYAAMDYGIMTNTLSVSVLADESGSGGSGTGGSSDGYKSQCIDYLSTGYFCINGILKHCDEYEVTCSGKGGPIQCSFAHYYSYSCKTTHGFCTP